MGKAQKINGYLDIAKDLLVGKAAGESTFGRLLDIAQSPETYEKARGGTTISEDVNTVVETLMKLPGQIADGAKNLYDKTVKGIAAHNSGGYRGL